MRILLALLLSLQFLLAYPTIKIKYNYYTISPKSKSDIKNQILKNSPTHYAGFTKWRINYHYKWKRSGNQCKITKTDVKLTITHTMPKILNPNQADKDVRHTFEQYYDALLSHEKNHKKISRDAAFALEEMLLSYKGDCSLMKSTIKKRAKEIFDTCKTRNKKYDETTQHGKTEGVLLEMYF